MAEIKQAPEVIPVPVLTDRELQDREKDLKDAMKLHASIAAKVSEILPLLREAAIAADKLEKSGRMKPVLRAAMMSRRLEIPQIKNSLQQVLFFATKLSSSVVSTASKRTQELEETIRDPKLLR